MRQKIVDTMRQMDLHAKEKLCNFNAVGLIQVV